MNHIIFQVYHENNVECGELLVKNDKYYTLKWFYPLKTEQGITFSNNHEIFKLETFQEFMENIRNDVDCVYRRDNEDILEYENHTFRINPDSCQTGLNFDSSMVDFRIRGHKKELLKTLEKMYDWFSKFIVNE